MKKFFTLCLGLIALAGTSNLYAQIGNFATVNMRNLGQPNAAVLDVGPFNVDFNIDVNDDMRITLGQSTTPSLEVEFDGFTGTNAFEVSRIGSNPYIALFRPNGVQNNVGHLESGTYGNITSTTSKWLGLGSAPAGAGPISVYGLRSQWGQNFGIFNLVDVNATTKDLVVAWGGTSSNNRLRFNYADTPTGIPTTYMQVESDGRVGIGRVRNVNDLLYVDGRIGFGSAEYLEDGGGNTITSQSSIVPLSNNSRTIGNATFRWSEIFATNGMINTSDRRDKEEIVDMNYGLEEIMELRPVTYSWKDRPDQGTQLGLIAQEVEEVLPEVVYNPTKKFVYDEEGKLVQAGDENARLGLNYSLILPVMINGMQEQQTLIEEQAQRIDELEQLIANGGLKQGQGSSDLRIPTLYQNSPNPFRESTEIRFYLPEDTREATLYIYDMQGAPVLELAINERGESSQRIDGGMLESGMYLYALIADGQEVDVKRMILTK